MNTEIKTAKAVAVGSTLGGELISYKRDGQEYVWEGLPEYCSRQSARQSTTA